MPQKNHQPIGQTKEGHLFNQMTSELSKPLRKLCKSEPLMVTEEFGRGSNGLPPAQFAQQQRSKSNAAANTNYQVSEEPCPQD